MSVIRWKHIGFIIFICKRRHVIIPWTRSFRYRFRKILPFTIPNSTPDFFMGVLISQRHCREICIGTWETITTFGIEKLSSLSQSVPISLVEVFTFGSYFIVTWSWEALFDVKSLSNIRWTVNSIIILMVDSKRLSTSRSPMSELSELTCHPISIGRRIAFIIFLCCLWYYCFFAKPNWSCSKALRGRCHSKSNILGLASKFFKSLSFGDGPFYDWVL